MAGNMFWATGTVAGKWNIAKDGNKTGNEQCNPYFLFLFNKITNWLSRIWMILCKPYFFIKGLATSLNVPFCVWDVIDFNLTITNISNFSMLSGNYISNWFIFL